MGRTILSSTQVWNEIEGSLLNFRRALRKSDQEALDQLCVKARQHLAAASYAAAVLPMESFLLSMLLEQQKEINRLQIKIENIEFQHETHRLDS